MDYRVINREARDLTPEEVLSDAYGEVASRLEKPIDKRSFVVFGWLLALGLSILGARLFWLTIVHHPLYAGVAEANRTRRVIIPGSRGLIYDRTGKPLVRNIPAMDLVADPIELPRAAGEREKEAAFLTQALRLSPEDARQLSERFLGVSENPVLLRERLSHDDAVAFAAREDAYPGVTLHVTPNREYLYGEATLHALGLIGRVSDQDIRAGYFVSDLIGKSGVEAFFEPVLRGNEGEEIYEVDARGKMKKLLSYRKPIEGEHLVLALDAALQRHAYDALAAMVERQRSPGGALVALDPRDGKILALVSAPSVDANIISGGIPHEVYESILRNDRRPLFNRAISSRYPPGSTLKLFIGAAALAEGVVTTGTIVNDTGAITIADIFNPSVVYTFRGYAPLGPVDIYSAISRSSDIYFYTVGGGYGSIEGLGADRIAEYLRTFGFGQELGIDMPGENSGLVPTRAQKELEKGERWRIGDTYNISIGQGDMGVTPLQLAASTAVIANRGTLWRPRLAMRTIDKDFNTLRTYSPHALRSGFIPADALEAVRLGMRQTVMNGTARLLGQLPVSSAAKTGTVQTGRTSRHHALVTVFAPYEDPEIVLAIVVEKSGEGSEVAVPLARDILQEYFRPKSE